VGLTIAAEAGDEFIGAHGGGADFANDDAGSMVGNEGHD